MKSKPVEFQPPEGVVPEGTSAGESFDLVCTFSVKDNGSVCLTVMGDSEMPGYDKGKVSTKEDKPGYGDMAQGMMAAQPSEQ